MESKMVSKEIADLLSVKHYRVMEVIRNRGEELGLREGTGYKTWPANGRGKLKYLEVLDPSLKKSVSLWVKGIELKKEFKKKREERAVAEAVKETTLSHEEEKAQILKDKYEELAPLFGVKKVSAKRVESGLGVNLIPTEIAHRLKTEKNLDYGCARLTHSVAVNAFLYLIGWQVPIAGTNEWEATEEGKKFSLKCPETLRNGKTFKGLSWDYKSVLEALRIMNKLSTTYFKGKEKDDGSHV